MKFWKFISSLGNIATEKINDKSNQINNFAKEISEKAKNENFENLKSLYLNESNIMARSIYIRELHNRISSMKDDVLKQKYNYSYSYEEKSIYEYELLRRGYLERINNDVIKSNYW